jgi:hypothetical protein
VVSRPPRARPCATLPRELACRRFARISYDTRTPLRWAREDVPLLVIQRQLGHTNLAITSIYPQGTTAPRSSTPSTPGLRPWSPSTARCDREPQPLVVQPDSEAAVGEGARRLLHSPRTSGLDLRSRSSSLASASASLGRAAASLEPAARLPPIWRHATLPLIRLSRSPCGAARNHETWMGAHLDFRSDQSEG